METSTDTTTTSERFHVRTPGGRHSRKCWCYHEGRSKAEATTNTDTTTTEAITIKYRKISTGHYDVYADGEYIGMAIRVGRHLNRTTGEHMPDGWYGYPASQPGIVLWEERRKDATATLLVKGNVGTFEQRSAWRWEH